MKRRPRRTQATPVVPLPTVSHTHVAKVAFRDGVEAGRRDARREYGMSRATATKLMALAQERKRLLDKRSNTNSPTVSSD